MSRTNLWLTLSISLLMPSAFAADSNILSDIRVIAGASIGYSEMSFPEKLDHDISFPSTNIPIILTKNRWQLAVNTSITLKDADISEEEDIGDASRKDIDLTLGYQVSDQWALFAGYKMGKTKMSFTPRDNDEDVVTSTNESYKQKGPFIGISYSWQFERAGRLSVSVGYADLDAINRFAANTDDDESEDEIGEDLEFDDLTGRVDGDMDGFSYGVNWTMPVSDSLLFQTRLKVNDYEQDIDFEGTKFSDIDETFTSLHVGVAYVF